MANKRPLCLAAGNSSSNGGGKQTRFEIKPLILKRSEIYNHCAPVFLFKQSAAVKLQSCLRRGIIGAESSASCQVACSNVPTAAPRQNDSEACCVQFRSNVTVKRIPSRFEYPESTRKELWSSLQEIKENALRNEAEFLFDGGDWRACCEEEDMYYDKFSGSLVHPAHVGTVCVFNGNEWKSISKDESTEETVQHAANLALNQVCIVCEEEPDHVANLPQNQVCIVCDDYPGDIV